MKSPPLTVRENLLMQHASGGLGLVSHGPQVEARILKLLSGPSVKHRPPSVSTAGGKGLKVN